LQANVFPAYGVFLAGAIAVFVQAELVGWGRRRSSYYAGKATNVLSRASREDKQLSQNWNSMQPPSMLYRQSSFLQAGASATETSQRDGFHSFAVTKVSLFVKILSHPSHGLSTFDSGISG